MTLHSTPQRCFAAGLAQSHLENNNKPTKHSYNQQTEQPTSTRSHSFPLSRCLTTTIIIITVITITAITITTTVRTSSTQLELFSTPSPGLLALSWVQQQGL